MRKVVSNAAASLTTPLLPDNYLELVNPLWSRRQMWGRIEAVQPETIDAATLVIRPGLGWTEHQAGQHVRLGVDVDGVRYWRTYSLSSPPERQDGRISVTVKAAPDGLVSRYLVHRVTAGTVVRLEGPRGGFVLPPAPPPRLLFLTAGSGITPVMSILRGLVRRGQLPDLVLVHSAPTPRDVIFGAELRGLAARLPKLRLHEHHTRTRTDDGRYTGRLTVAALPAICPDWTERWAWACGPTGLLDDAEASWQRAGLADRLRVERFQPAVRRGGVGGRVRFVRSGREANAGGDTPLLVVGENAGVLMPSGCRMGICHSCVARLTAGRVRDLRTGLEHGDEGELVQTCVSAAAGDVEIDL
ncbi:stearoyl-CoA 9-desaturase [Protofrankia sp. BMG5.30]|uniref:Stearoyl-CoA 9-desaturase n=1 Tax=Protofrankia coriariae TaxID=1562887 RepID=A0ABR5F2J7_9ACTN|nr:stearoyl-CoA 9-desaturase [Protofrankia coriariae]ONH33915.1 stearoyl-CoA 9-desaturase [Protofrankia sp. BMG5.30]